MPAAAGIHDRLALARALREIGQRLVLRGGDDRFRAQAYERAARTIERTGEDVERLAAEGRLATLPGIGAGIAAVLTELYQTGESGRLTGLRKELPASVVELAPVVGLPTARKLCEGLGALTLAELERACVEGRVQELKGFGPRREAQILARIRAHESREGRILLSAALAEGGRLVDYLQAAGDTQAELVGGIRRAQEEVGAIEVLATTAQSEKVLAHFAAYPLLVRSQSEENGASGILASGAAARLFVTRKETRGTALVRSTGSAAHLAALGPVAEAADEASVYRAGGLPFIPPELRYDEGEIEAARAGRLPKRLVEAGDVQGAVHCHTVWSDGRDTLLAMARAAEARGFRYMTVTDHSPSAPYAGGLTEDRLKAQWDEIASVQEKVDLRLLRGSEADITEAGAIDWPDRILEQLDVVIVSIHQRHKMDEAAMTKRVARALAHPAFKIWGHARGRLIGRRPPFACDIERVLDALAGSRGAIELNGDPHRLDMEPHLARLARERGLRFVISTDAHSTGELGNVRYGTLMARRAWLSAEDVLNTRSAADFTKAVRPRP